MKLNIKKSFIFITLTMLATGCSNVSYSASSNYGAPTLEPSHSNCYEWEWDNGWYCDDTEGGDLSLSSKTKMKSTTKPTATTKPATVTNPKNNTKSKVSASKPAKSSTKYKKKSKK